MDQDLVLSVAWLFGIEMMVSLLFDTIGSPSVTNVLFLHILIFDSSKGFSMVCLFPDVIR